MQPKNELDDQRERPTNLVGAESAEVEGLSHVNNLLSLKKNKLETFNRPKCFDFFQIIGRRTKIIFVMQKNNFLTLIEHFVSFNLGKRVL